MVEAEGNVDWADETVSRIGSRVAALRRERGISAQQLAYLTAEVGYPVSRGLIAKLENGYRGVSVPELLVLARALAVPPWALVVDLSDDSRVAALPGGAEHPWEFVRWFRGDVLNFFGGDVRAGLEMADMRALIRWHRFEEEWKRLRELNGQWQYATEVLQERAKYFEDLFKGPNPPRDPDTLDAAQGELERAAKWVSHLAAQLAERMDALERESAREVQLLGRGADAAEIVRGGLGTQAELDELLAEVERRVATARSALQRVLEGDDDGND